MDLFNSGKWLKVSLDLEHAHLNERLDIVCNFVRLLALCHRFTLFLLDGLVMTAVPSCYVLSRAQDSATRDIFCPVLRLRLETLSRYVLSLRKSIGDQNVVLLPCLLLGGLKSRRRSCRAEQSGRVVISGRLLEVVPVRMRQSSQRQLATFQIRLLQIHKLIFL